MKKINIFFAAWGTQYVKLATSILLPSLLQAGNLPSIVNKYDVSCHIYCEQSQIKYFIEILKSASIKIIFIDINSINQFNDNEHKYGKMTSCHRHFLSQIDIDNYAVFMHPDFFVSDNLFSSLDKIVFSTDCECYFSHVMRITNENITNLKNELFVNKSIDSYRLIQFALENPLPLLEAYNIENNKSSSWPIEISAIKNSNLFVYSFGMHPLVIRKDKQVDFQCFDHDLPEKMYGSGQFEFFKVQRDNRDFMIVELNYPNMKIGITASKKQSPIYCAALYNYYLPGSIRDFYFSEPIVYYKYKSSQNQLPPDNLRKFISSVRKIKRFLKYFKFLCAVVIRIKFGNALPFSISE